MNKAKNEIASASSSVPDGCLALNVGQIYQSFLAQPKSVWWACAYLVCEYVRPQSIYPAIDFLPWPLIFILLALYSTKKEKQPAPSWTSLDNVLVYLSILVLISSFFAYSFDISLKFWRLYYDWMIIYFVIKRVVNTPQKLFLFVVVYFLANFKMSQHGFVSWASRGFRFAEWGVMGAPGWFANSGEFGIQLSIFVPMIFCFIVLLKSRWGKIKTSLMWFALMTGVASAIASSSRGALVGLFGAFFWFTMKSRHRVKAILLVSILSVITYLLMPGESLERFSKSGEDNTSKHRIERWQAGWDTMKKYPILGIGPHCWDAYYSQNYVPVYKGPTLVHNMFVEAGSELGFTGIILYISAYILCFARTAKIRAALKSRPNEFLLAMANGLDGALIGLILSGSFVTVFYYPYFWIHCLFVSCLTTATKVHVDQSQESNIGGVAPKKMLNRRRVALKGVEQK